MQTESVFVHIVCYKSSSTIERCVAALLAQEGFALGQNLRVRITDNNDESDEDWVALEKLQSNYPQIEIERLGVNLGFAAGHNLGVGEFLRSDCGYLLILNPDLALAPSALLKLTSGLANAATVSAACPLLLRADAMLNPLHPPCIDGLGMCVTASLRHFDSYAGEHPEAVSLTQQGVFGASGAAFLASRAFIEAATVDGCPHEADTELLYPQLAKYRQRRVYLFDEAFFAYREDADLAWRANLLGLATLGIPDAVGYHVRRVTPERRAQLPAAINRWSVRNRFLLLLNNAFCPMPLRVFFKGMVLRNLVVVFGVLCREWGSLAAFVDLWVLRRRAGERRRVLRSKVSGSSISKVWGWFR
ncbi:MAG: glycosyltransferase family 2 protein [Bdellovibrionota bacterium]|nr:MAG: glycosyltransferase family 2 protein [Bdellovibrionota bacterium]